MHSSKEQEILRSIRIGEGQLQKTIQNAFLMGALAGALVMVIGGLFVMVLVFP